MNILILSDLVAYSGVGQYMIQLGNELLKHTEVDAVVVASPVFFRNDVGGCISKKIKAANIFSYMSELHKIIKEYNITIVHCNHRKQAFYMRIYQLIYGKIPVVWTCHTVPYPNNWIKRLLGYYGHKSIAISSEAQVWMHEELKINNLHLDKILNGVDNSSLVLPSKSKKTLKEEFFRNRFNKIIDGNSTKIIVAHGRLHPVKGLNLIIDAFSELTDNERRNLLVVFSGDTDCSYYLDLQNLIAKYKLSDYFFFAGWVKSDEILSIADLMLQPSIREGFLLAAIEAFFMRVPVIRSKTGGYKDMEDCCVGVPIGNAESIVQELKKWVAAPDRLNSYIDKAYEFAMTCCTVKAMTNNTLNTYKNALKICF